MTNKFAPDLQIASIPQGFYGRYLAAGGSNGTVRIWDIENGQLVTTDTDYGDAQIFPHYAPEDGLIAAAVSNGRLRFGM